MIRPIDAYPWKVETPTTEYPDGKARNITSPGDGTGTPWEAKLVNDLFGFQQYITAKAGITPNGTPDNATASQQFDALWKLLNVRSVTHNIGADANYTLTADQNLYAKLEITDTGGVLTQSRAILIDSVGRVLFFTNSTTQFLVVKVAGHPGQAIPPGSSLGLLCDGTLVTLLREEIGVVTGIASTAQAQAQADDSVAISPLKLKEALQGANQNLASNGYQKLPGGLILQWGTNGAGTHLLPISFPTSALIGLGTDDDSAVSNVGVFVTNTQIEIFTGDPANVYWFAIGY